MPFGVHMANHSKTNGTGMASMEENDNIGTFGRAEWTTGTPFRKVEKRKGSKGWIFLGPRAEHLYKQCQ